MKNLKLTHLYIFICLMLTMTGCELIGDIFEAGFWVGVILVILVIFIIIWLISKLF